MPEDISFDPDEAQEGGGGVVQAVSGAVLSFECVLWDYRGTIAVPVPAIHVHGDYEDEEGEDADFDEYYSGGDPSRLKPSKDGKKFIAVTEGAGLVKTCKAMQLLNSIVSANGGDKEIVTDNTHDIKGLDGINVDMQRKPDIDRAGLEPAKGGRKRTILLVTDINALPGEKPSKKKKGAKKKASKGKAAAIRTKTIEAVCAVVEFNDGEVEAADLSQMIFKKNKKDSDVKAMTELAADEDFLNDDDTPWEFDGTTLTYEAAD